MTHLLHWNSLEIHDLLYDQSSFAHSIGSGDSVAVSLSSLPTSQPTFTQTLHPCWENYFPSPGCLVFIDLSFTVISTPATMLSIFGSAAGTRTHGYYSFLSRLWAPWGHNCRHHCVPCHRVCAQYMRSEETSDLSAHVSREILNSVKIGLFCVISFFILSCNWLPDTVSLRLSFLPLWGAEIGQPRRRGCGSGWERELQIRNPLQKGVGISGHFSTSRLLHPVYYHCFVITCWVE